MVTTTEEVQRWMDEYGLVQPKLHMTLVELTTFLFAEISNKPIKWSNKLEAASPLVALRNYNRSTINRMNKDPFISLYATLYLIPQLNLPEPGETDWKTLRAMLANAIRPTNTNTGNYALLAALYTQYDASIFDS
jgi:hypothetical protein